MTQKTLTCRFVAVDVDASKLTFVLFDEAGKPADEGTMTTLVKRILDGAAANTGVTISFGWDSPPEGEGSDE